MKKFALVQLLLLVSFVCFSQSITITESGNNIIYRKGDVYRSLPKRHVSTLYNAPYFTLMYRYETIFRISNNATVTFPTSTSMLDLQNKINVIISNITGGGGGGGPESDPVFQSSPISGVTSTNISNWTTAYSNSHIHGNKAIIDNITSTSITQWAAAYSWGNYATKSRTFNVVDYGATDNGTADDDKPAFQAAIEACKAAKGTLLIPAASTKWDIRSTLSIVPVAGQNEVYMDIEAHGEPQNQISYSGAAGTAVFYIKGLRFAKISGLKVRIADGANENTRAGVVAFDLDTDDPSYSTTHITFKDCHAYIGNGINVVGWRMGHISGGGADISNIQWENCSVWGNYGAIKAGSVGWLIEGANTLQNTWVGGFGAYLDVMFSNKNRTGSLNGPGNGACYFYGLGSSHNNLEYEIHNTQTYTIFGGRYEVGKRFLTVTNSNDTPNIIISGIEINDYNPTDNILFYLDRPASLTLQNVNIMKDTRVLPYTDRMITLYGGGDGAVKGTLIVDNGSFDAADPFYWKGNATPWSVYVRGVGKTIAGVRSALMKDKHPYFSPNGTSFEVTVNDAGQVISTTTP